MVQLRERPATIAGAGAGVAEARRPRGERAAAARVLGALALLAMGAVHLEEYFGVHYRVVPTIGPLFALDFAGAVVVAAGLLLPLGPLWRLRPLLALGGIAMAATAFVFLLVSEHTQLFGFMEHGYRPAVIAALAAEAAAALLLAAYLAAAARGR
jgi:hypothetical protein